MMKVIPLSEGSFTVDKTKEFVPFDKDNDKMQDRPAGSLLVEIQPFVIRTKDDIFLLDTGLGFKGKSGKLMIHENLEANGIDPSEVTAVLMSHLHKDHGGGIAMEEHKKLSFPNATYYVRKEELEFGLDKANKSYIREDFEILSGSSQLELIGDQGMIRDIVRYEHTGAHSPFHIAFHIEEDGEHIFFGGDVAPQLQQMKNRFIAKYDFDGKKAMKLRQEWWEKGRAEGWNFLFYHDIKTPTYKG